MNREIVLFVINGGIAVFVAFIFYRFLMLNGFDIVFSSIGSYLVGIFYGYFANKNLTFKNSDKITLANITKYIGLHLCTLAIFVNVNSYLVVLLEKYTYNTLIAFIVSIKLTTIINFFGLRFWVFKKTSSFSSAKLT